MNSAKMPTRPGIYAIVNRQDKKLYIGKSSNIRARIQQHVSSFKKGKHTQKMQAAYDNDPDSLECHVIFLCDGNKRELDGLEAIALGYFLNKLGADSLYNTFTESSSFGVTLLMHSNANTIELHNALGLNDYWCENGSEDISEYPIL